MALSRLRAVRRPALVAVVSGCSAGILATGHAPLGLLASSVLCWSVLPIVQVLIALPVVAGPARRSTGIPRALDLFFASHVPWSLWMLFVVAWAPTAGERTLAPVLAAALVPMALTPRMIAAFFRDALGLSPREARMRTAAHQAITWTVFIVLYGYAIALVPRVVGAVQGWFS